MSNLLKQFLQPALEEAEDTPETPIAETTSDQPVAEAPEIPETPMEGEVEAEISADAPATPVEEISDDGKGTVKTDTTVSSKVVVEDVVEVEAEDAPETHPVAAIESDQSEEAVLEVAEELDDDEPAEETEVKAEAEGAPTMPTTAQEATTAPIVKELTDDSTAEVEIDSAAPEEDEEIEEAAVGVEAHDWFTQLVHDALNLETSSVAVAVEQYLAPEAEAEAARLSELATITTALESHHTRIQEALNEDGGITPTTAGFYRELFESLHPALGQEALIPPADEFAAAGARVGAIEQVLVNFGKVFHAAHQYQGKALSARARQVYAAPEEFLKADYLPYLTEEPTLVASDVPKTVVLNTRMGEAAMNLAALSRTALLAEFLDQGLHAEFTAVACAMRDYLKAHVREAVDLNATLSGYQAHLAEVLRKQGTPKGYFNAQDTEGEYRMDQLPGDQVITLRYPTDMANQPPVALSARVSGIEADEQELRLAVTTELVLEKRARLLDLLRHARLLPLEQTRPHEALEAIYDGLQCIWDTEVEIDPVIRLVLSTQVLELGHSYLQVFDIGMWYVRDTAVRYVAVLSAATEQLQPAAAE